MNKNLIECSQISVNCVPNELIEGSIGPDYLGFDFNVKKTEENEMKKFIVETLKYFDVPLVGIATSDTIYLNEDEVCTKQRIIAAISSDASYLKEQNENNNYPHFII